MRIGIAGPIKVFSLKEHFKNLTSSDLKLGLGGTAVNILIDGFIKAGHSVTVFTLDPTIRSKYILEGDKLKIIFGNFRISGKQKTLDFRRKEALQIKRFILEEKASVDIVNAHWSYEFAVGTILTGLPHLITFRDHSPTIFRMSKRPYNFSRIFVDFWVRRRAQNICYNSPNLKLKVNLEGVVIPNLIKEDSILQPRKYPTNKQKIKIYYIANGWDNIKNPMSAIRAFAMVSEKRDNVELHLIGIGAEPGGKNHAFVEDNGLSKGVIFRGSLSHEDLMEELPAADILLHTSREESFGNTLVEAMSRGIPTVAGKNSGAVPWVLDNGKAGILVDVEDPLDVARGLMSLLTNEDLYEEISYQGIQNVRIRFSQKKVCEAYMDVYRDIIKK